MNEVSQKIERIKSIFLDTQVFYAKYDNIGTLIEYLENTELEFRSIGYESASIAIALKEMENFPFTHQIFPQKNAPAGWYFFSEGPALKHKAQVYIGLGWAVAKLNLPFLQVVQHLETRLHYRVADGCGYYDGSFRQRQTVINQQVPVYLPEAAMSIYDQGVGRSLWYTSNADINKIHSKVDGFPASRHADLWRGIGIAVAYVGGCDDNTIKAIFEYAGEYRVQLACGAALAAKSRMEANTLTTDTNRCSRLWLKFAAGEANMFSVDPVDPATIGNEAVYFNWITQIEEGLANSFKTGK